MTGATLRERVNERTSFEVRSILRILLISFGLVILATVFSDGVFLQPGNLVNLGLQNTMLVLVSLGQLLVILTGGIDLSVGAILALSSVFVVIYQDLGVFPSVIMGLGVAAVLGLFSGGLVTFLRLPSFVVTLGMMQIASSLAMVVSKGGAVYTGLQGAEISPLLPAFYKDTVLSIPSPILFIVGALVLGALYLRTSFGHFIYPVGGNEPAAYLAGIPIKTVKLAVYGLSALLAGVGGALYVARVGHGYPQAGQWLPLDSIAAVSIGGASLAGGLGTVVGTLIGVFILSVLNNIMNLLGVPPTMQPAIKGIVILMAVFLNSSKKQK